MYVLFLFLMVEGGGYSEMKFKLWYCCRDLDFLKIWPSWIITLITVHEKLLNETTKKDIFTDMFYLSDKR